MIRKRIKAGIGFRIILEGNTFGHKPGIYLDFSGHKFEKRDRINKHTIIDLHTWLGRYINTHIKQIPNDNVVEARAHANAIKRNLDSIEANEV